MQSDRAYSEFQPSEAFLRQEYTIPTPENVSFGYEVVGIGNRFIAALIDTILITIALVLLNFLVLIVADLLGADELLVAQFDDEISWQSGLIIAIYTLINFFLYWGYYIGFEWLWQGQTPGKRWIKIRVVRIDGNPVGIGEVVIRNLVRLVDIIPGSYAVGFVTMFFSEHAQRLGDYAAGTLVVRDKSLLTLDELLMAKPSEVTPSAVPVDEQDPLYMRFANIRSLSRSEFALVEELLRRHNLGRVDLSILSQAARHFHQKLGLQEELRTGENRRFLEDVVTAYRRYGRS